MVRPTKLVVFNKKGKTQRLLTTRQPTHLVDCTDSVHLFRFLFHNSSISENKNCLWRSFAAMVGIRNPAIKYTQVLINTFFTCNFLFHGKLNEKNGLQKASGVCLEAAGGAVGPAYFTIFYRKKSRILEIH